MLLIGSAAAKYHTKYNVNIAGVLKEQYRAPKDLDFIVNLEELFHWADYARPKEFYPSKDGSKYIAITDKIIEFEISDFKKSSELIYDSLGSKNSFENQLDNFLENKFFRNGLRVLNFKDLVRLKSTHLFKRNSPHFEKTRKDFLELTRIWKYIEDESSSCFNYFLTEKIFIQYLEDLKFNCNWIQTRIDETYNYKHPSLNTTKSGFFKNDGIKYVYDHDSLHEAVAFEKGVPAYKYYLKDNAEVMVDYNKWDKLDLSVKLNSVIEEATVLALERSLIPFNFQPNPKEAFITALQKICTSITSGQYRAFAYMAYDEVIKIMETGQLWNVYPGLFKEALTQGIVKPYKKVKTNAIDIDL